MSKPFAPSAASNRHAILDVLQGELQAGDRVLEIGSGTGQHAVHVSGALPDVHWQPSDLPEALPGMRQWFDEAGLANVAPPIALDVTDEPWPAIDANVCYTANTLHIISEPAVAALFAGCARVLASGGRFCIYGPFAFHGRHVSASNARFSESLQQGDPASGVRDLADLDVLAAQVGFHSARIASLPSNNHLLVFDRAG